MSPSVTGQGANQRGRPLGELLTGVGNILGQNLQLLQAIDLLRIAISQRLLEIELLEDVIAGRRWQVFPTQLPLKAHHGITGLNQSLLRAGQFFSRINRGTLTSLDAGGAFDVLGNNCGNCAIAGEQTATAHSQRG